jgi:hypothetical protein
LKGRGCFESVRSHHPNHVSSDVAEKKLPQIKITLHKFRKTKRKPSMRKSKNGKKIWAIFSFFTNL